MEPADKLRAVRTTPRPTADENTVLLAIFRGVCVLMQAKEGAESQVEDTAQTDTRDVTLRSSSAFRLN